MQILSKGRGTGFPKIYIAIDKNGSPVPQFETDTDRIYFLVIFKRHHLSQVEAQVEAQVELNEIEIKIINYCKDNPKSKMELATILGYDNVTGNLKRAVNKLVNIGLIEFTIPEKKTSINQKYRITKKGISASVVVE